MEELIAYGVESVDDILLEDRGHEASSTSRTTQKP
jgi:hypothetical protein